MTNNTNRPKVTVTCDFNVNAATVFNAWLDPKAISQWMFGEAVRNEIIIKLENDPREGGVFSYVVQRGNDVLNHTGTYLEIRPYTRLIFTWGINLEAANESIVSINIEQRDKGCFLSLTHEMDSKWASYASRTEEGWTFMLAKLRAVLKYDEKTNQIKNKR